MSVKEKSGLITIEIEKIEIKKEETKITTSLDKKEALTWNEIIAKAKKSYKAAKNEIEKGGIKVNFSSNSLEAYDLNE